MYPPAVRVHVPVVRVSVFGLRREEETHRRSRRPDQGRRAGRRCQPPTALRKLQLLEGGELRGLSSVGFPYRNDGGDEGAGDTSWLNVSGRLSIARAGAKLPSIVPTMARRESTGKNAGRGRFGRKQRQGSTSLAGSVASRSRWRSFIATGFSRTVGIAFVRIARTRKSVNARARRTAGLSEQSALKDTRQGLHPRTIEGRIRRSVPFAQKRSREPSFLATK